MLNYTDGAQVGWALVWLFWIDDWLAPVLPFKSISAFIIVDWFLLETCPHLAPRISALLPPHWPLPFNLLCCFLQIFAASKYWNVPGLNLRLAPFSVYSHLLADLIHSPNFNPTLVEAWVLPLIVSHILLPTRHLQLAIEPQTLHSLSWPTKINSFSSHLYLSKRQFHHSV